ncbi:MAG: shikimate kinase [Alphaproteobacteria bacterium]|nr:shikimate kinase [Alphaproteobacteria bacterium]
MSIQAKNATKAKPELAGIALRRSIVLVGLMGAGKTTIGKRLAHALGVSFVDSDHEIVEAAGCSISDIFAIYGEEIFRDLEQRVLLRLLEAPPCVLATGGGAFVNPAIREAIKQRALSVWLKAELEVLVERVSRRDTRPLLQAGDKREILSRLMQERHPLYAEADIVIDSTTGAHEAVVEQILTSVAQWQRDHG